jgi:hypothetical protein
VRHAGQTHVFRADIPLCTFQRLEGQDADAHAAIEARKTIGKTLLAVPR